MTMSSITIAPLPSSAGLPIQKETTAGNYFVSNYPPFAFWKAEDVPVFEKSLEQAPTENVPLGLYVHIPFCRKRCHFCYFRVYTDKNADDIREYIEAVLSELRAYVSRPALVDRKPKFIYFGGGTPVTCLPIRFVF